MKDHGKVRGTIRPQPIEITSLKVFVSSNITEVTTTYEDQSITEFEYEFIEYDKDEYIELISSKNESMEKQITETQLALCEIYEAVR